MSDVTTIFPYQSSKTRLNGPHYLQTILNDPYYLQNARTQSGNKTIPSRSFELHPLRYKKVNRAFPKSFKAEKIKSVSGNAPLLVCDICCSNEVTLHVHGDIPRDKEGILLAA